MNHVSLHKNNKNLFTNIVAVPLFNRNVASQWYNILSKFYENPFNGSKLKMASGAQT
jgi:hypothetical protein